MQLRNLKFKAVSRLAARLPYVPVSSGEGRNKQLRGSETAEDTPKLTDPDLVLVRGPHRETTREQQAGSRRVRSDD